MTPDDAMKIGMEIAEKHRKRVLRFIYELDQGVDDAMQGHVVWLAAEIMRALRGDECAKIGRDDELGTKD